MKGKEKKTGIMEEWKTEDRRLGDWKNGRMEDWGIG
jgi:hypothetical protein